MKNLDLEKIIIILSLLLMPVAGGWIYMMKEELKQAEVAFNNCDKTIADIHFHHNLITVTKKEFDKPGESIDNASVYFQNRALASQKTGIITADEITVNQRKATPVRIKRKLIGEDIEVKIEFRGGTGRGRGGKALPRSFINAFIFNSEMEMPVWKLRNLKLTNVDFKGLRGAMAPKNLETTDEWVVNEMIFARRKPASK